MKTTLAVYLLEPFLVSYHLIFRKYLSIFVSYTLPFDLILRKRHVPQTVYRHADGTHVCSHDFHASPPWNARSPLRICHTRWRSSRSRAKQAKRAKPQSVSRGCPVTAPTANKMGGACLGWLHVSVKMECQSMLGSAAVCPFSPPATLGLKWIL